VGDANYAFGQKRIRLFGDAGLHVHRREGARDNAYHLRSTVRPIFQPCYYCFDWGFYDLQVVVHWDFLSFQCLIDCPHMYKLIKNLIVDGVVRVCPGTMPTELGTSDHRFDLFLGDTEAFVQVVCYLLRGQHTKTDEPTVHFASGDFYHTLNTFMVCYGVALRGKACDYLLGGFL
jgi:hypothetical protein